MAKEYAISTRSRFGENHNESILTRVGILLVILSATPLPLWAYAVWLIPAVAGLYFLNRKPFGQRPGLLCWAAHFAATIFLCFLEIPLLPKRFFAKVLGTPDGTLDGLHLSQEGHNALANIIADVLQ